MNRLKIWNDFDENGMNLIYNLLTELIMGQCYCCLYARYFMIAKIDKSVDYNPDIVPVIKYFLEHYLAFKQQMEKVTETGNATTLAQNQDAE